MFLKTNSQYDARMNKRRNVIFFDGIIHEHLKAEEEFDSRNRPQIVKPRLKAILQKLLKKYLS